MSKKLDATFLQCCIDEVRDGEDVTIHTSFAPMRVKQALLMLGATEEELRKIRIVKKDEP